MSTDTRSASDVGTTNNRSIVLTCRPKLRFNQVIPTLNIDAPDILFEQTIGHPSGMNGRVDDHGDINLTNMPLDPAYNDNVDITINLDTSNLYEPTGKRVAGRWAFAEESSGQGETGFAWFCGIDDQGKYTTKKSIDVPGMRIERLNDVQLRIYDDTPDTASTYAYAIALVLPGYNNYYITIDPRITSKSKV